MIRESLPTEAKPSNVFTIHRVHSVWQYKAIHAKTNSSTPISHESITFMQILKLNSDCRGFEPHKTVTLKSKMLILVSWKQDNFLSYLIDSFICFWTPIHIYPHRHYSVSLWSWKAKWLDLFSSNFVYPWGQCWHRNGFWVASKKKRPITNPFRWINTVLTINKIGREQIESFGFPW